MKSDFIKHFVFGMFTFLAPIGLWAGEGTDFPDQPPAAPPPRELSPQPQALAPPPLPAEPSPPVAATALLGE